MNTFSWGCLGKSGSQSQWKVKRLGNGKVRQLSKGEISCWSYKPCSSFVIDVHNFQTNILSFFKLTELLFYCVEICLATKGISQPPFPLWVAMWRSSGQWDVSRISWEGLLRNSLKGAELDGLCPFPLFNWSTDSKFDMKEQSWHKAAAWEGKAPAKEERRRGKN